MIKSIREPAEFVYEEKRSRFLGAAFPVSDAEQAEERRKELKKAHPFAKHICYAYVLEGGAVKASDDGEPKGTAGAPILSAIQKQGFSDVALFVTRYFGGVKLGSGGLLRAYAHTAAETLKSAAAVNKILAETVKISVTYAEAEKLKNLNITELSRAYGDNVDIVFALRNSSDLAEIEKRLQRKTERENMGTAFIEI